MTDHPIPDDLLDWLNAYEWDDQQPNVAHKDHVYDAWCAICRGDLPRILSALAEWADGSLIDPAGWRRLDAKHRMMTDREGNSCFTLTERAEQ